MIRRVSSLGWLLACLACGDGVQAPSGDAADADAGTPPDVGPSRDAGPMADPSADAAAATCDGEHAALATALDSADTDADFSLMLRCASGGGFEHSIGASTPTTEYDSASTSKWVTATVILRLVDQRRLALDDHPQQYLDFWTRDPSVALSRITLRQLLSFTSGLHEEALCINLPGADLASCTEAVFNNNLAAPNEPGTTFYYNSAHMQVAGLMAMRALGAQTWGEVFDAFQRETGLFPNGRFDLPSEQNPRLAGGMHWRGEEYLDFLEAFFRGQLLSTSTQEVAISDQVGELDIVSSPASALGEQWHYGLGLWLECSSPRYDCPSVQRISSPGAYGAYPWIDLSRGCMGMLARQGALRTFRRGKELMDAVGVELAAWMDCIEP